MNKISKGKNNTLNLIKLTKAGNFRFDNGRKFHTRPRFEKPPEAKSEITLTSVAVLKTSDF